MNHNNDQLLSAESKKILQEEFSRLEDPVEILLFTDEGKNKPFSDFSRKFLAELSEISSKILSRVETADGSLAAKYGITRVPSLMIQPEQYSIRFIGAPAGEEAQALMTALLMVSAGTSALSEKSRKKLRVLDGQRNIKVFVSPTCPYCPLQSIIAIAAVVERPDLISVEIIEIHENRDLALMYNAVSVPQVFINDHLVGHGLQPEEAFIDEIMTVAPSGLKEAEASGTLERDLVIIGAGPAGLTAAIYAERSGLKTVVLEKGNIGGQVAITPIVENYPGFTKIGGKTLMDMMAQQASQYSEIHEGQEVLEIARKDDRFEVRTGRTAYKARAVLIVTGAQSKKLGIPGEKDFQGKGVSYCAACDGFFFKDGKKIIVVGGGNTAATEALYLKNIGADVTIVHRRDQLRAEKFLQLSLEDNKIPVRWNSVVKEIKGENVVSGVVIEDVVTATEETVPVDGVFIAIGYVPSNDLALKLGVMTDEEGYLIAGEGYRTNVKGVYAAGDITGGVKQIVTAVGQGAVAAMSIFEDLSNPYWKEKE